MWPINVRIRISGGRVNYEYAPKNVQDFMLILDSESTRKWHCNKKSNNHSGCKNESKSPHHSRKPSHGCPRELQNLDRTENLGEKS